MSHKYIKTIKLLALLTAVALISAAVLLPCVESFHRCSGEHCPVCAVIARAIGFFRSLAAAAVTVLVSSIIGACVSATLNKTFSQRVASSPVGLKVKLTN